MRRWVRAGIRRFGQNVVVRSKDGIEQNIHAFLQPVLENGETLVGDFSSAGWLDQRRWRYIGQTPLKPDDLVLWQGFAFRVRSCREVCFQNAVCFWQASLEREMEEPLVKELRQIRDAVIRALRSAGLEAGAAFPDRRTHKHSGPFAVVAVGGAEGKAVGFCNYLGELTGPDGSPQELYGKQLNGDITIDIRGDTAKVCDDGCETASDVLLSRLPEGIRPGELKWDALCWDKNLQMFLRHGALSCEALFIASPQEDEGGFCDFILKGVLFS